MRRFFFAGGRRFFFPCFMSCKSFKPDVKALKIVATIASVAKTLSTSTLVHLLSIY